MPTVNVSFVPNALLSPSWTTADTDLALDLGIQALARIDAARGNSGAGQVQVLDALKALVDSKLEAGALATRELELAYAALKQKHEEAERARAQDISAAEERGRMHSQQALSDALQRASAAECALEQVRAQTKLDLSEKASRERDSAVGKERAMHEALHRASEREMQNLHEKLSYEKASMAEALCEKEWQLGQLQVELKSKEAELSKLQVSAIKGNVLEGSVAHELSDMGLFVANTSKGAHNLFYGDLLVSFSPLLTKAPADGGAPVYEGGHRLCFEWKGYKSSSGITAEVAKFAAMRKRSIDSGRADCYCFVATAPIPGKHRHDFEVNETEGGRSIITAYLGAHDVTAHEIGTICALTLSMQKHLDSDIGKQPMPQGEALNIIREAGVRTLTQLRTLLGHADRMRGHIESLTKDYHEVRCCLISTLLMHWSMLKESHLSSRNDDTADIDDALTALHDEKRSSSSKLVRTKAEHDYAREALHFGKRKRDD